MAGLALVISLFAFVAQTELMTFISHQQYEKPVFMMTVTHGSWVLLVPLQVVVIWLWKRDQPFEVFVAKHRAHLAQTAQSVCRKNNYTGTLPRYMTRISIILAISLNVAAISWYLAINLTTAADITAIYNCSAFFAYAFSIPLLKEKWRSGKVLAIVLSVIGVLVVAYSGSSEPNQERPYRVYGNLIIGAGAVLYGLYEVLYKVIACPEQHVSAKKQAAFANVIAACIGAATWVLMVPTLLVLHITGIETFEAPDGPVLRALLWAIFANMLFSGSFLILMSLTSPVFGSVASLLTTFMVPLVDFILFGRGIGLGNIMGGAVISVAFLLMMHESWQEMQEDGLDD